MNKNPKKLFWLISFLLWANISMAQNVYTLSMDDAIALAEKQSPDALLAKTKYRQSYWRYRYYKAAYLPALSLTTNPLNITRAFSQIPLPDGRIIFVPQSLSTSSVNLSLTQQVGLTGGSFSLNSGLQRIDLFNTSSTSYLSTPVNIAYSQQVLTYNDLKWQKRIEPLYFQEARKQYVSDMEDVHIKTITLFFDILAAQSSIAEAKLNKANSDTLYKLGQGRYNLGRIAENELLQLELDNLNSGLQVQQFSIIYSGSVGKLKSFLGLNAVDSLHLKLPVAPDTQQVSVTVAAIQANSNNPISVTLQRQGMEASRDVARAIGTNGVQANVFALYGLNGNAPTVTQSYANTQDQEQLQFGITIPLLDWGKAHGAIEMAKAQEQLAITNIKKSKTDFDQEVALDAAEYNLQNQQLIIATKANDVSQRRYYIAKERYLLGKIGITDLNIAQTDRDAAQKSYIDVLRNSWITFYNLRKITLYDFNKQIPLEKLVTGVF